LGENQQEKKHRIWQGVYVLVVDRTQEYATGRQDCKQGRVHNTSKRLYKVQGL